MATFGQVPGRCDKKIGKKCSPCSRKGSMIRAEKFCLQCNGFFCHDCSDQHDSLLSNHPIKDIGNDDIQSAINLPTEMCQYHSKLVDLYCQGHDMIGCATCMALDHRDCKEVVFIPNSTRELLGSCDKESVHSKLLINIRELESIRMEQQDNQEGLDNTRQCCLDDIDVHYVHLQNLLCKIMQASKYNVDEMYKRLNKDLKQQQVEIDQSLTEVREADDRLSKCDDNDAQLFIVIKKSQKTIVSSGMIKSVARENLRTKGFRVRIDDKLERCLSHVHTLSTVMLPFRATKRHELRVSVKADKKACLISGTCVLKNGSVLLVDHSNRTLKLLDAKKLSVTDHCMLENAPRDVCCINDSEAVVTQGSQLTFISTRKKLKPIHTLTLTHKCSSVACSDNKLLVIDWDDHALFMYNISGTSIGTVTLDSSMPQIFSDCRNLTVTENGDTIFAADYYKGIITLDRQGRVLSVNKYPGIKGISDVWLDGSGGMLIVAVTSNHVFHIDTKGNVLGAVMSESDGIVNPASICYDSTSKRIYISQYRNDNHMMLVFELG